MVLCIIDTDRTESTSHHDIPLLAKQWFSNEISVDYTDLVHPGLITSLFFYMENSNTRK